MMKLSRSLLILALAGLAFGSPAYAQGHAKASQTNASHLMQSYRQKNQQLRAIQQKTVKNNPKLAKQMKQFQAEVNKAMRAHGFDAAKEHKHMEAMVAKLKSGKKVTKAQRMAAMKSFQAERMKMRTARAAAMKEPKIQKDGMALQNNMIAAMKKQDSRTGPLLKDVKSLRTKLMAAMAARRAASKKGK